MSHAHHDCSDHDHGHGATAANPVRVATSSEDAAADLELPAAFGRAEAAYKQAVDGDGGAAGQRRVADALEALLACVARARAEGALSSNEELRDMSTESLRYLLSDFYIATLRAREPDPDRRLPALRAAQAELEAFLETCWRVGVTPRGAWRADERRAADGGEGTGGDADALAVVQRRGGQGAAGPDAEAARRARSAVSRDAKIERYRRNQEAKRRIAELAAVVARASARARGGGDAADDGDADAAARELATLELQVAARTAEDDLASIAQEVPLLLLRRQAQQMHEGAAGGGGSGADAEQRRLRREERGGGGGGGSGGGVGAVGPPTGDLSIDPRRPGLEIMHIGPTFDVEREVVRARVFTSSIKPPTMSMEDWGDIVTAKREAREAREAKQSEGRVRSLRELAETGDEDDSEAYERAQERARRFDDWADGVPKGAGVTKRV